ncbi:MAG: SDR family oxidoreductase, partial [Longimicrobiales bacterium]
MKQPSGLDTLRQQASASALSSSARESPLTLVIGGSRGTGLLIAQRLNAQGHRVRVLARQPAAATRLLGPGIEVVAGDITRPATLTSALPGVRNIIFTAGVRSTRPAGQALVKATDYQGVLNTLDAAQAVGFSGRFVYMTSIGVLTPSWPASLLNLIKGNTLVWRRRVEEELRTRNLDYTIVRAGFLMNGPGGQRAVTVSQNALPLAFRNRIARADVAELFVHALLHPRASRTTLE